LKQLKSYITKFFVTLVLLCFSYGNPLWAQEPDKVRDSTSTTFSFGKLQTPNPESIVSKYTYDPVTNRYYYNTTIGSVSIDYPIILTPKEFETLVLKEGLRDYYKEKIDALAGQKEGLEDAKKNLIPEFYVKSNLFQTIFGGGTISLVPQGSVEMDLGMLYSKQENPSISPRNQSNLTFDFDQRISLSLSGKVGTRLLVNANYDTESTFDFQNVFKIEYTPLTAAQQALSDPGGALKNAAKKKLDETLSNSTKGNGTSQGKEDSILRKLEFGNVNMPLNSSLITGAQSLFGVKTELQFGKTTVRAVFSEQKSETKSVVAQGGGTVEEFDFFGLDYDENRHFFLGHYFRDNYDKALGNYPFINSQVQITRIEVWVTNRTNRTENIRNIIALQDLGESNEIGLVAPPVGFINVAPGTFPDNSNNDFDPTNIGATDSQLTSAIRDIATVQSGFLLPNINEGFDYGKLENAQKLIQNSDYTVDTQLGYISLSQRLQNDEVLAVAYQYTIGDQVYQVGEFANDGLEATSVGTDQNSGNQTVTSQNLILKMLKSTVTNVDLPIWDLMMKNIYNTGAYQLTNDGFKLNIFYNETSSLNFITPVEGTPFPTPVGNDDPINETPLIRLFNFDRLNFNNDPQNKGDGFFDFVPGITVIPQNGKIIFTKVEPFGSYLFETLRLSPTENYNGDEAIIGNYNPNQQKYVYSSLYKSTKTAALQDSEKNKFQIKGRYKSTGSSGIPIGAFNVPRGSVKVTAGGRVLVEGVDYTVNYQMGTVQMLDPSLQASNIPIQVSVENNAVFGQQTRRFTGFNVEHQFNENFLLGATFLNMNERPITQKANYGSEPINNSIFGVNGNFSSVVPFLTRMANKLPNIDTDVPSNLSLRGEFAYLKPGAPKGTDFDNEVTSYIDDFEGTQNGISLLSPQAWNISSRPLKLGRVYAQGPEDANAYQNGFDRALLNWYTVDPIFYSGQRPQGISDDDISNLYTRRVFINEIFPEIDLVTGQYSVINTLDLVYDPTERGPYNYQPGAEDGVLDQPQNSWAGISRQLTNTDFEQSNVEYIEFWLMDPFIDNPTNTGGKLTINLGNISEDVIKDGKKQYENGLPEDGNIGLLPLTSWGTVTPQNQSLVYAFSSNGQGRTNQDVGLDGFDDAEEVNPTDNRFSAFSNLEDPANDNYEYYLNTEGDIFERYKKYNGLEGNSPDTFTQTNRGSTTQPDVEDINRDNTMNTIDSYFSYVIDITPTSLSNPNNPFIVDRKVVTNVTLPNGSPAGTINWYQFRIPLSDYTTATGGISDFRSIRFSRLLLTDFTQKTVLRFGTFDLVRSDWRRYQLSLDEDSNSATELEDTDFSVGIIGVQENDGSYVSPPGVVREQLNNNNTVVRQNEQSLVLNVCELESEDSRAAFKNINVDMRQYKKIKMFIHAEDGENDSFEQGDLVAFVRMGNDFTQNYYQLELPLRKSSGASGSTEDEVWPQFNEINIPLEFLEIIKARGISDGTLANENPVFYNVIDGELEDIPVDEFEPYTLSFNSAIDESPFEQRIAVKGNPNFGDIRTLMVGVKNIGLNDQCARIWFNELRIAEMDNEGGWAAVMSMDTNIADFMNLSATAKRTTTGFGSLEQGPNQRSREDLQQYDVVTNVNIGQLLPQKWGLEIPFNYGQSETMITPEYDQQYKDLKLQNRIDAATSSDERERIRRQSEDYTKHKSINFIGVRKQRTGDKSPQPYDVENLTLNYSYNEMKHRDFEIEDALDQNVRVGANYAYSFNALKVEPFKKMDSLFNGKYWKLIKDFNFNLLPNSLTINTDVIRQFNKQKFRDADLGANNITIDELIRRNYTFDFQYTFNYNLTDNLQVNFSASNNNIVRNYFIDDNLDGDQDPTLDVWDGFLDFGDPNIQSQQLGVNYKIPINKIPTFEFIDANYTYSGDFQWTKGSDLFGNLSVDGQTYDLGNSISNANTHNLNTTLNMNKLYSYLGIKSNARARATNVRNLRIQKQEEVKTKTAKARPKKSSKLRNFGVGLLTSAKRVQVNYSENNGTFLPGYLPTPGFLGSVKPTFGYTLGSQRDVRRIAAENGWLTTFEDFNQQYTETYNQNIDFSVNLEPVKNLKIDLTGGKTKASNLTETFNTIDSNGDGFSDVYNSLIQSTLGNFNITTSLIKTAFSRSDEIRSEAFDSFKSNRLQIAQRLAQKFYGSTTYSTDAEGYPLGFGKNSQAVLLPSFLSAYSGKSANQISLGAFRDIPLPNWTLKYTGFMGSKWFKKRFKRFSLTHGYSASYTINQLRTNLDYQAADPSLEYSAQHPNALDQSGNFKNETLFSNINLVEQFNPLIKVDFEMKNSIKISTEIKKDRMLSLSFDNNLLTEIQGYEYIFGLGYRIKDLKIRSKLAGPKKTIKSDLNMKADLSIRNNKTIIRYLDLDNNQVSAGQTLWSLKYAADYAFSKNLTAIFYFDYNFSEYAISTSFPQTTIRSGFTLRYNFGN
jgi:cell surface protein SprA